MILQFVGCGRHVAAVPPVQLEHRAGRRAGLPSGLGDAGPVRRRRRADARRRLHRQRHVGQRVGQEGAVTSWLFTRRHVTPHLFFFCVFVFGLHAGGSDSHAAHRVRRRFPCAGAGVPGGAAVARSRRPPLSQLLQVRASALESLDFFSRRGALNSR